MGLSAYGAINFVLQNGFIGYHTSVMELATKMGVDKAKNPQAFRAKLVALLAKGDSAERVEIAALVGFSNYKALAVTAAHSAHVARGTQGTLQEVLEVLKVLRTTTSQSAARAYLSLFVLGTKETVLNGVVNHDPSAIEFAKKTLENSEQHVVLTKTVDLLAKGDEAERREIAELTGLPDFQSLALRVALFHVANSAEEGGFEEVLKVLRLAESMEIARLNLVLLAHASNKTAQNMVVNNYAVWRGYLNNLEILENVDALLAKGDIAEREEIEELTGLNYKNLLQNHKKVQAVSAHIATGAEGVLEEVLKVLRLAEGKEEAKYYLIIFASVMNKTAPNRRLKNLVALLDKGDSAEREEIAKLTGTQNYNTISQILSAYNIASCLETNIVKVSRYQK